MERHLARREERRRVLYERARSLRRTAQHTMTRIHAATARPAEIAAIRREMARLVRDLPGKYPGDEGLAEDALQEGVEAILLAAAVAGRTFP
ncbi:MAG TPA: hypothetical protein VJQ43_06715, partial [Thermoplasmata archaeon]|nr:hypothetical protein [Thermoplasmata archaeon]